MWRKELYSTKALRGETLKLCYRTVTWWHGEWWWPRNVTWWHFDLETLWHGHIVTLWYGDIVTWWPRSVTWWHCDMETLWLGDTVTWWHGDPEVWRKELSCSRWSAGEVSRAFPQKIPPPLLLKLPTMHLRSKTKKSLFQNKDNFKILALVSTRVEWVWQNQININLLCNGTHFKVNWTIFRL